MGFTDFDTLDDGSLIVPDWPASNADISQSKEERVLRWMGGNHDGDAALRVRV